MVNNLTFSDAIAVSHSAQRVLSATSVQNPIKRIQLDNQLIPSRFADVQIILSGKDSKTALSIAIISANKIIGALNGLKSSAKLAKHESLVSNLTNLQISLTRVSRLYLLTDWRLGLTRVSRLNLNVDTNRALQLIDGLVSKSEVANANFISSTGPNIRINTTRFGGTLDVMPQPLDSLGLGLRNVSLLTPLNASDAEARLTTAINTATRRTQGLETLQRAITGGSFLSQNLASLIYRTSGDGLPKGTLVNLLG